MYNADLYNLTQSLAGAFFVAMGPVRAQEDLQPLPDLFNLRAGYAESPGWFLVQATEFDPEPLTMANLRARDIYASPGLVAALLEIMASEKWLERRGERYFLTSLGRGLAGERRERLTRWLSAVQPPIVKEIEELERSLAQIIETSLNIGTPPGNWCLIHSRNRAPNDVAPAAVKVYQYSADFNAFRDDAHMAAWRPLGVDGRTWEAFSLLHGGSANSATALFDQLAYRGYSEEDYAAALSDLQQKGWINPNQEHTYTLTSEGEQVWQNIENLTNDYFFAPWQDQGEERINNIIELMARIRDTLQQMGSLAG